MSGGAFQDLDFARYAPQGPRLVASQPNRPPLPGELGQLFAVIRNASALICVSLRIAAGIVWRRFREWFEDNVLHSLTAAWAIAGLGWGGFILLSIACYIAR